jgi:glutathionyl-hydroquinone reductase
MSEDAEIKSIIPNYYNLIIDKLNKIYDAWDKNLTNLALSRALKLIPFLPRKLKKQLNPEKTRISTELQNGIKDIKKIAEKELEPLVDKITDNLDEAHLLTQNYGIPTRKSSIENIGKALE